MKSLDITPPSGDLNFSSDRQVTIKFVGGTRKNRLQTGYTDIVFIPYRSFSQRIREIHRSGGKIIDVAISCFETAVSPNPEIIIPESFFPETGVEEELEKSIDEISMDEVASLEQENPAEQVTQVEIIEDVAIAPEIDEEAPDVATEAIVEVEKIVAIVDSTPVSEPNPKRSRASSKAGGGFNKSKAEVKTTRSSKKTNS